MLCQLGVRSIGGGLGALKKREVVLKGEIVGQKFVDKRSQFSKYLSEMFPANTFFQIGLHRMVTILFEDSCKEYQKFCNDGIFSSERPSFEVVEDGNGWMSTYPIGSKVEVHIEITSNFEHLLSGESPIIGHRIERT